MRRPGAASHILKGGPDVSSACAKCPPASLTLRGPPDGKPLNIGLRDVNISMVGVTFRSAGGSKFCGTLEHAARRQTEEN